MKNTAKFAIVAASVAGGLSFVAAPAEPVGMAGAHCVANADNGKVACADTEQQARQLVDLGLFAVKAVELFDGKNVTGGSLPVETERRCAAGYEHEYIVRDLGVYGWDNRASSLRIS